MASIFAGHLERISAIRALRSVCPELKNEIERNVDDVFDYVFYEALFSDDYSFVGEYTRYADDFVIPFGCFVELGRTYWIIGDAPIQTEDDAKLLLKSFLAQGQ